MVGAIDPGQDGYWVERVRERLRRATAALEAAGVPYAVVDGNAVAAWVATVDPSAVRNTQDVDILFRRVIWMRPNRHWRPQDLSAGMLQESTCS